MNTRGIPVPQLPHPPTLSDREEYVTDQVMTWLDNERDISDHARTVFTNGGAGSLKTYVVSVVRWAPRGAAAWHLKQEMAANDYDRVAWSVIGAALVSP